MPQNKVKQHQQHKNKQKYKCNNGTIEEQKDIKQVHSEKVHVKIVEQWDIHVNNVHKDQEKYVQSIQVQTLLLMMLLNKLIWIGKVKEIDGMDMIQKCIKKLLRNIGNMRRLGSRLSQNKGKKILINSIKVHLMRWNWRVCQQSRLKIRNFKGQVEFGTDKTMPNIY